MKKLKIILDILMFILMLLLMKTNITGLQIHEIIGIIIFILFILHKILNFTYVKSIGKNIFNKKLKLNSKIIFWFDVLLLIVMIINVFSGVFISKFIFKFITINNTGLLTIIHKCFAWWTLILISIHIGFHLDRLTNFLTKKFTVLKNKYIKIGLFVLYLIIAILGIISLSKNSIYSKLIPFNEKIEINNNTSQEKKYKNQNSKEEKINNEEKKHNRGNESQDKEQKEDKNPSPEVQNKKYKNQSNILDIIYIVILFSGASHYINTYIINKKKE